MWSVSTAEGSCGTTGWNHGDGAESYHLVLVPSLYNYYHLMVTHKEMNWPNAVPCGTSQRKQKNSKPDNLNQIYFSYTCFRKTLALPPFVWTNKKKSKNPDVVRQTNNNNKYRFWEASDFGSFEAYSDFLCLCVLSTRLSACWSVSPFHLSSCSFCYSLVVLSHHRCPCDGPLCAVVPAARASWLQPHSLCDVFSSCPSA